MLKKIPDIEKQKRFTIVVYCSNFAKTCVHGGLVYSSVKKFGKIFKTSQNIDLVFFNCNQMYEECEKNKISFFPTVVFYQYGILFKTVKLLDTDLHNPEQSQQFFLKPIYDKAAEKDIFKDEDDGVTNVECDGTEGFCDYVNTFENNY